MAKTINALCNYIKAVHMLEQAKVEILNLPDVKKWLNMNQDWVAVSWNYEKDADISLHINDAGLLLDVVIEYRVVDKRTKKPEVAWYKLSTGEYRLIDEQ